MTGEEKGEQNQAYQHLRPFPVIVLVALALLYPVADLIDQRNCKVLRCELDNGQRQRISAEVSKSCADVMIEPSIIPSTLL